MKVAVIGAGVHGLICIKICKDYGLDVECFEQSEDIGGTWRYKPEYVPGEPSVMKFTVCNTSKEMMAFSDFPPPAEFPPFMHHEQYFDYIRMYVDKFNLIQHVKFNTQVKMVKKSEDYDKTGQWTVTTFNKSTGQCESQVFDAVFIANGHNIEPYVPEFRGLSKFQGRVIHCCEYREFKGYEGKKVIVVGTGYSGGDVASELSLVAKQVYLVTRVGNWCLSRMSIFGLPYDMIFKRRFVNFWMTLFPNFFCWLWETMSNFRFNHEMYGLKSERRLFGQHVMLTDDLPGRILNGKVVVKPDIQEFSECGATFEDGTAVDGIDEIILCTGYNTTFPMLSEDMLKVDENRIPNLYKNVFPVQLKFPTMFIIGLIEAYDSAVPMTEIQARLCCEVLLKRVSLPKKDEMKKVALEDLAANCQRFESRRHMIHRDPIPYTDSLAQMMGAKPNLLKYALTDFPLFSNLLFGPFVPYQYRLQGPHPWEGARQALMATWDRTLFKLKSSRRPSLNGKNGGDDQAMKNMKKKQYLFIFTLFSLIFGLFMFVFIMFHI